MDGWTPIDHNERPRAHALIVYYVPFARYIWGSGVDFDQIKAEYPGVTHWKEMTREPEIKE